jgi:hypothetical protein
MTRRIFILLLVLLNFKAYPQPDYWANLVYFNGSHTRHIPEGITVPENDIELRSIMNSILHGSSYMELNRQFPDSLKVELSRLINGKLIQQKDDHFKVLIPVLTGDERSELKTFIHEKVEGKCAFIYDIIDQLSKLLSDHSDMIFHFLWSRVIDNCWWDLYKSEFKTKKGPPSLAFIVYPFHPFQCGTNFDNTTDNSQIAITWSYSLLKESYDFPSTASFYNLVLNKSVSDKDKTFFVRHGLVGPDNESKIFVYEEGGELDQLCATLKKRYIENITGVFDYEELSKVYQIPADELFVIMSHEIAYEFFELLQYKKEGLFIPISREKNPDQYLSSLISIRLSK